MTISRRHLLTGTAAGVAAGSFGAPALLAQSTTQLSFAFAEDESGAIQNLIDGFNAGNDSGIEVAWTKAPENTDEFFRFLVSDFMAGADDIDFFGSDVIWTAELAARDWIVDLSQRIYRDLDTSTLLPSALNSVYHRNRLWAVPWYTDAGMLFYRSDLLEEAGLEPPETWDDLASAARTIMDANGVANGLVLQGARYEGGVTNCLEFIWSAGGRAWTPQSEVAGAFGMSVADPNVIVLNSADSVMGLSKARELVDTGIVPTEVTTFNERDALEVFASGDAVFMRNWPFAYGLIGSDEFGPITPEQVGVARIPTLRPGRPSYSCLGGWNLAMNARSRSRDAIWEFIQYALQPAQQRAMAETGGFLPVRAELYEDQELREAVPVIALGDAAVQSSRSRPISTIYSLLSIRLAVMFNRILTGEVPAEEAVRQTERELRNIVAQNRY